MQDSTLVTLSQLPQLKSHQWEKIEITTLERIQKRLGNKPELRTYIDGIADSIKPRKLLGMLLEPMDYVLIPLLLSLFAISLSHMLHFSGTIASASYKDVAPTFQGIWMSNAITVLIMQVGSFFMAEFGILFFYNRHVRDSSGKRFSLNLIIAFCFALYTFIANIVSLLHNQKEPLYIVLAVFLGLLVPVTTLFLGDRIAEVLLVYAEARSAARTRLLDAESRYVLDMSNYTDVLNNPKKFNDGKDTYRTLLARTIVDYYKQYVARNASFDWTPELEVKLAAREIAAYSVMDDLEKEISNFLANAGSEDNLPSN